MPQTSSPTDERGNYRHYKCCSQHRFRGRKSRSDVQEPGKTIPDYDKRCTAATPVDDIKILPLDDIVNVIEHVQPHRKTQEAT